ncbi:hypothetical protein OS493_024268 [Desmophyllum pertusum]|uniref:Uncharacterized protein n=1 Tax=Desmophyllum pertusum TaxID=174260 RepID=A0A9X0CPU1_9CNID|nr:hypothetical protein OS493_024268 [Desmophyllum pertusum]
MQECLVQCAAVSGDNNFQFYFNIKNLLDGISTCDVDQTLNSIINVKSVFEQCERLLNLERRRRQYRRELNERIDDRERKETVKRLTRQKNFRPTAKVIEIPSPPSTQPLE